MPLSISPNKVRRYLFDRILVSTAKINHLTIVTPDKYIKIYKEIKTIW